LRFRKARAGDHMCHFRNIYGRDPKARNLVEVETMEFIRQVILDSFWSREPTTVRGNLQEAKRGLKECTTVPFSGRLGYPPMGPFPLSDDFGMIAALVVLDRLLDSGRYLDYVQWEMFGKARSAITNISQAGSSGLGDAVGAYERNRSQHIHSGFLVSWWACIRESVRSERRMRLSA
jgi:hypothetical protein